MAAPARVDKQQKCPIFCRDGRRGRLTFCSVLSAQEQEGLEKEKKQFHAATEIESEARSCPSPPAVMLSECKIKASKQLLYLSP